MYMMYNSKERIQLDPKSRKCIFLGYTDNVKGYCLWDLIARKVISRDVIFLENELQRDQESVSNTKETTTTYVDDKSREKDSSEAELEHNEQEPYEVCRTSRQIRKSLQHLDYVMTSQDAYCFLIEEGKPSIFEEALKSPYASLWMTAMQEELEVLHRNKMWELVPLPEG